MTIFVPNPPENPNGHAFRILRTPATSPIVGIVTSPDPTGARTHYANNRTTPCTADDTCKLCREGYPWRWHGYVSAMLIPSLEHVLFEFTAPSSDAFANYHRIHNTLRACRFRASRPSKRHNGRVVIETRPDDEQRLRLPDPPNLQKILCHIWSVRYDDQQPKGMCRPPYKDTRVGDNGRIPPDLQPFNVVHPNDGF
jgi:hypothetical protein